MRTVVPAFAVLATLAVTTHAEAASRQALNRCNDAVSILRSNPGKRYEREDIDPLDTRNAVMHQKQILDGWTRARAKLDQVPAAELDDKDPELAECFTEVRATEAYLKLLGGKVAAAEALGKIYVPFLASVTSFEKSFMGFLGIAGDPTTDRMPGGTPADLRRMLDDLAKVEKECQNIPAEHRVPPKDHDPKMPVVTLVQRPFAWCRIAARRVELVTFHLGAKSFPVEGYPNYRLRLAETIEKLESNKGFMEPWMLEVVIDPTKFKAALKAAVSGWYAATGVPQPPDALATTDAMIAKLRTRVDEVAPTLEFEAGPHAAAIESLGKKALLKVYPKAKVMKTAMDAPDFEIRKNNVDIPTARFRSGRMMFKLPGSKHCVQWGFSYSEPYQGGGKFQKSSTAVIVGGPRFLSCS